MPWYQSMLDNTDSAPEHRVALASTELLREMDWEAKLSLIFKSINTEPLKQFTNDSYDCSPITTVSK